MGYEEQLSAAKFSAERDLARQECERLRARLRDSVPREAYERKRAAWLRQIRECEAALRKRREHIKRLENAALERRTVREEDREAAEWVREHGGLENVRDAWDEVVNLCATIGCEPNDESEMLQALGDCTDIIIKRLMPEGYEWPRYESGGLVLFGDEFINAKGNASTLRTIAIKDCRDALGGAVFWKLGKGACAVTLENGERVKRPAPKVLDSEGVECNVGDAVWWVHNKTGNFRIIRIEQDGKCAIHDDDADEPCGMTVPSTELTHKRPVIDADGVEIRVGDEVWDVDGSGPFIVSGFVGEPLAVIFEIAECNDLPRKPSQLTHRAPVLAADGKALREGETVWSVDSGTRYTVEKITDELIPVKCRSEMGSTVSLHPSQLTHERPVADSWERLEEDAKKGSCNYFGCDANGCHGCPAYGWSVTRGGNGCGNAKMADLMRRAKELAGRDA